MTTGSYECVVDALRANGSHVIERGDGHAQAQCPVPGHGQGNGDRNPSLSIYPRKDGKGTKVHFPTWTALYVTEFPSFGRAAGMRRRAAVSVRYRILSLCDVHADLPRPRWCWWRSPVAQLRQLIRRREQNRRWPRHGFAGDRWRYGRHSR